MNKIEGLKYPSYKNQIMGISYTLVVRKYREIMKSKEKEREGMKSRKEDARSRPTEVVTWQTTLDDESNGHWK